MSFTTPKPEVSPARYACCGTMSIPEPSGALRRHDYHATGCPRATYPWTPGTRICAFDEPAAAAAEKKIEDDAFWCDCGNPSGETVHRWAGTDLYVCVNCSRVTATG